MNGDDDIEYISRFWVDGREHHTKMPQAVGPAAAEFSAPGSSPDLRREIEQLQARISQLISSNDEQRLFYHRVLLTGIVVTCCAILLFLGYQIYLSKADRLSPPRGTGNYVQVPVKVNGETVLIGLEVVEWQIPPSLNGMLDKLAQAEVKRLAAQQRIEVQKAKPWYIRMLEKVGLRKASPPPPDKEQGK